MKLLLFTRFYPSIGGLETVMELLAEEWAAAGHEVRVATDVPEGDLGAIRVFPFEVYYQPTAVVLYGLVRWCEVYIQGCVGLKTLWPLALCRRRYFATHHTWYRRGDGSLGWPEIIKRWVSRFAFNIAPSQAIANDLPVSCSVIPNPFRENTFRLKNHGSRKGELIFVGRLVSDKGVGVLLQAMALLRKEDVLPSLTIVGTGPELSALKLQAEALQIAPQISFAGSLAPDAVADLLNDHRILVVPSLWHEPFGVVALEGIACGCLVIGSREGGLREAIGPCGLTFPNGDADALASAINKLLCDASSGRPLPAEAIAHLEMHRPAIVARRYLDLLQNANG